LGQTALARRSSTGTSCFAPIFIEYPPQTGSKARSNRRTAAIRSPNSGGSWPGAPGRCDAQQISFDSVGFAIEDFLALQYVRERVSKTAFCEMLDMIADPDDPRDLYGIQERAR
jgi:ornithine cyclodeaminase